MRRCYPVLTPFKFNGVIVKPECFIEFDAPAEGEEHSAQALEHIAAGVVDPDWVEAPQDGQDFVSAEEAAEAARLAAEQAAAEAAEAARLAAEQAAAEAAEAERLAAEQAAAEAAEAERHAAEQAAAEAERLAAAEKLAAGKSKKQK